MSHRIHPFVALVLLLAAPLQAQQWSRGDELPLIRRAATQRTTRDADTALAAWRATAHGIVRSALIVDQGSGPVERLMKLDELTVEVYGEIPDRSKQVIARWRDTSFLPNRIQYHRDHLGIVANDFGATIRLGNGEEVRDLIHPLSEAGLTHYLFAIGDTITLQSAQGTIRVNAVEVRPRDPLAPGTVGTLYLDTDRAALVRFRFTFTPASYIDRTVRDITVMLESALRSGTRWLPWRQSIVIRREEAVLELPMHTVLRADWTLGQYALGVTHPVGLFAGPLVGGPLRATRGAPGDSAIIDQMDRLPAPEFDVDAIQRAASAMLEGRLLDGLPQVRSSLAGYSDLLHVNRVSGVSTAMGIRFPLGRSLIGRLRGGYGFSDHRLLGLAEVEGGFGHGTWTLSARRALIDLTDAMPNSNLSNSISTATTGNDYRDWTLIHGGALALRLPIGAGRLSVELAHEESRSVIAVFHPIDGDVRSNPALGVGAVSLARMGLTHRDAAGFGWSGQLEGGTGAAATWARADVSIRSRFGRLRTALSGGIGTDELPGYRSYALGGVGTLPGLDFRGIGGRGMLSGELGYAIPVAIPLPLFGFIPASRMLRRVALASTLMPFVAAGAAWGEMAGVPWRATGTVEPVAGVRLDLWGDLLRIEGGVSLRHGGVGLAIDLHPDWWPVY